MRMARADRAAYQARISDLTLEELTEEINAINRQVVAVEGALRELEAVPPGPDLSAFNLEDADEVLRYAEAGHGAGPDAEAVYRATVLRHGLEIKMDLAQTLIAERRRDAGQRAARADLAKRIGPLQAALSEIRAHEAAAYAAGGRPLINKSMTYQLEEAVKEASGG